MQFKRNVGPYDRVFRVILGTGLLIAALVGQLPRWAAVVAGVLGATQVVEGAIGY